MYKSHRFLSALSWDRSGSGCYYHGMFPVLSRIKELQNNGIVQEYGSNGLSLNYLCNASLIESNLSHQSNRRWEPPSAHNLQMPSIRSPLGVSLFRNFSE